MKSLIMYSSEGCHLCEIALDMINMFTDNSKFQIKETEISDSYELMEKYGIRIPVVKVEDSEEELGWPFTPQQLLAFLAY